MTNGDPCKLEAFVLTLAEKARIAATDELIEIAGKNNPGVWLAWIVCGLAAVGTAVTAPTGVGAVLGKAAIATACAGAAFESESIRQDRSKAMEKVIEAMIEESEAIFNLAKCLKHIARDET